MKITLGGKNAAARTKGTQLVAEKQLKAEPSTPEGPPNAV